MKINLRTTKIDARGLRMLAADVERRVANVATEVGRELAAKTENAVVRRIPSLGDWTRLYKDAIEYLESAEGNHWAVAGLSPIEISELPALESLLYFSGNGFGRIMMPYNPWTLMSIPPLRGDYYDNITVRPAAPAQVEARAEALSALRGAVESALGAAGAVLKPDGIVKAGGETFLDVAYMARSLELGLDGRRQPHWGPAASELHQKVESWGKAATRQVDDALRGGTPATVPTMTAARAEELARIRRETWS